MFQFNNVTDQDMVLFGGPYYVFGRVLLLKIMPKCFLFKDDEISQVPVWVKLPGLPFECWHSRALGKITSKVGKPISTDRLTFEKKRMAYACVLIEIDASVDLVRFVPLKLPDGQLIEQNVIFKHEPNFYNGCQNLGTWLMLALLV